VRQSTLDQIRHHHEGRRRQYQSAQNARGLRETYYDFPIWFMVGLFTAI
jgi:hypothetical protein